PRMGIIIENMGLYPEFTGFKNLKYLASINNLITDEDIRASIARVGLDPNDKRTIKKYSLGMRQRIILAQAFMEHPDILLLDEPTNGLDEAGIKLVRDILKEEAARGALIFISSHNKEDISYLCEVIYQMSNGRLEEKV
ncbi:MAG TPA: multidrug ABC transporter ATP-binding protein, partial [Lachnospiraceae bacterium]|nr:multidrug ABC transporter ATP-binding protein [Lachnospiraceae bacterium]